MQGSLGFVDTLKTLTNTDPKFINMPSVVRSQGNRLGAFGLEGDDSFIGLAQAPITQNFDQTSGYRGYGKEVPFNPKLGDYILGHEFGHAATLGKNKNLSKELENVEGGTDPTNENFADLFQQSVQFLRDPKADLSKLNEKQAIITNILLQQPIYAAHPINQRRMLEQFLMGQQSNRPEKK